MRDVGCVHMLWCVTDVHGFFMAGVVCGNLDRPRFGRVVMTGITFGSVATYSCQIGYRLVGESTRTCQANRQWSGVAPVCKSEQAKKIRDQSTAAMSIHSGVCSSYQMLTLYYTVKFGGFVVVFGPKNIATIRCCHVEKLISIHISS